MRKSQAGRVFPDLIVAAVIIGIAGALGYQVFETQVDQLLAGTIDRLRDLVTS